MKVTLDFETRSTVSLSRSGAGAYSEHPSTDIICLALKIDNRPARIWIPEYFAAIVNDYLKTRRTTLADELPLMDTGQVLAAVKTAHRIEAHNAGFEIAIWRNVCQARHQWPAIPLAKWRCSAAKAAVFSLPRALDQVGKVLGLPITKDPDGHRIMLKLSKPRRRSKHNPAIWYETPEDLLVLFKYCLKDVEAEHCLSDQLRELSPSEQRLWRLDQQINTRGMYVDLTSCRNALTLMKQHEEKLTGELQDLTDGQVESGGQLARIRAWLKDRQGVDLPNLQAQTVTEALAREDLPPAARRAIEIRYSLSMSSTAKYKALVQRASFDSRIRGLLLFHGASTGRWAGMGVQPQNLPRGRFKETDHCIDLINKMDAGMIELFYGDLMGALSTCIRPMLCAAPGHELICADFSSIEGRVLAWLAREEWVLEDYRQGKDMYVVNAARTLGIPEDQVTKDLRQQYGKPGELSCGYQGGVNAVRAFGAGRDMTDEEIKEKIVTPWRLARPNIVEFWSGIQRAATKAVTTGRMIHYRNLTWAVHKDFLHCRLPSGRILSYFKPRMEMHLMPWGKRQLQLTYMGMNTFSRKWTRQKTYGGKLTENVVQAVARDIMAEAMLRLTESGYPIVLTVHDEVVSEVPQGFGSLEEYERLMARAPEWTTDLPIAASGWRGKRYRKD